MYLESPQNAKVKAWGGLKTKKGRQAEGAFLVEGARLVAEVLKSSLVIDAILWDVGTDELPDELLETVKSKGISFWELSPKAFEAVSDTVSPQGVIAVAKLPSYDPYRIQRASHAILLDGVQDPGNVGTLIRTADAFGLDALYCGTGTVDPFSPKVVRSSMGGLFRLQVESGNSVDYIAAWKTQWPAGQVLLTTAGADVTCFNTDFQMPSLVLIGSEAFGVSEDAARLATTNIRIPMQPAAESLNAAIAGSVLMYEMSRQRGMAE